MELLFLALMAVAATWIARRVGLCLSDQSVSALVSGFRAVAGTRPSDWPRGVQEEDRDRPWGSRPGATASRPAEARPQLVTVRPATRLR